MNARVTRAKTMQRAVTSWQSSTALASLDILELYAKQVTMMMLLLSKVPEFENSRQPWK